MSRLGLLMAVGFVALAGCGPLNTPLPERLADDKQKEVSDVWERALSPVDGQDRQTWLDLMVGAKVYQHGVDKLELRSEKRWAGGTVVMEVRYDRAKPDDDRFTLTVLDPAGKVLRAERYNRTEVDRTVKEFTENQSEPQPNDPPEVVARRAALEARMKKLDAMLKPAK